MGNRIQALASLISGKASLQECNVEEIKHLVQRHPYFAPAQFLLLQKLNDLQDPQAEAQGRKAVLYYPDPLQFEYFMSAEFFQPEEVRATEIEGPVSSGISEETEIADQADVTFTDALSNEEMAAVQVAAPEIETAAPVVEKELTGEFDTIETVIPEPLPEKEETPTEVYADFRAAGDENNSAPGWQKITDAVQEDGTNKKLPALLSETAPATAPAFEPYHTVDYFASQGIKPLAEELPKDKLGKGLKSFTEWLKTMKRLPPAHLAMAPEPATEKTIETMANSSVSNMDIVTEAMAEVWAKQGNREKAIETYNKLSLLYPPKKAFFAGKIENLKTS